MSRSDEIRARVHVVCWVLGFWIAALTEGLAGGATWMFASALAYCLYSVIMEGEPWFKSSR